MKLDWIDVNDSERIVAMAYDVGRKRIYVKFPDGTKWHYSECPPELWKRFRKASSKGEFIADELDIKPNGET